MEIFSLLHWSDIYANISKMIENNRIYLNKNCSSKYEGHLLFIYFQKKKLFQGNIFKSVRSTELLPLLNRLMDGTVVGFQGYWILS